MVDDVHTLFAVHIIMVSPSTTRAVITITIVLGCVSYREFKESSGHPDLCNQGEPQTDLASRGQRQSARRKDDTEQGRHGDKTPNNDSKPD